MDLNLQHESLSNLAFNPCFNNQILRPCARVKYEAGQYGNVNVTNTTNSTDAEEEGPPAEVFLTVCGKRECTTCVRVIENKVGPRLPQVEPRSV